MRSPSVYSQRQSAVEIPMTPMIDVVFQLIIFFLCTASFQITEQTLPASVSDLAGSSQSMATQPPRPEADFDPIVIRVESLAGRISYKVNDVTFNSALEVRGRLREIGAINRQAPVILHPDSDVPLGEVIDIYDLARLEQFNVAFTTTSGEQSELPSATSGT